MDKRYDFHEAEKNLSRMWEENEIYRFQNGKEKKIFSIDTPPPTVSGKLHIGHVFSYTQAEMIARFRRMQGYDVFYPFGFDDNGLPTERLVEREEKVRACDIPGRQFRSMCMKTAEHCEEEFTTLWKRLGFSVDWSLKYRTVSPLSQKVSQKSFIDLVKMKKAYMKESPVLWCTQCRTSIAQAELETHEQETYFNYLNFRTELGDLLIATTRPELLWGCVCIFVNPEDERYSRYIGMKAEVPLYGYEIPIIADEGADKEKGTGAVMCATFGDSADLEWYRKYSLEYRAAITEDGTINSNVEYIGGMTVRQGRTEIIRILEEKGLLVKQELMKHSVAVHERCKNEVEILPSNQWYIDVLSEKERFLKAADEINWYPEYMKNRYQLWVENLKWDWCISRQRYFGVPFPVWYCRNCKAVRLADESQLPVNPIETEPGGKCSCGCSEFIPETAVLDTWATSSVTPLINAKYGLEGDISDKILPMSMRTQAHEIIRTWAFYTIVKSLYHTGRIPWKDIMISGFVLAKPGEKISKSQKNSVYDPMLLIENNSADAIRYWAAAGRLGTDTFFSEEELKISRRFMTKLYNAARFVSMQLEDFRKTQQKKPELLPVDRWILQRVNEAAAGAERLLEEYETGLARHEIDELFWNDFCDYYIEIVKERLYQPLKHGEDERYSGQYALYYSFLGILRLYAIFTPYITDYIYQNIYRDREKEISIHQTQWDKGNAEEKYLKFGKCLKELISRVRKDKTEAKLSLREPVEKVVIGCPEEMKEMFVLTAKDIMACTQAEKICFSENNNQ